MRPKTSAIFRHDSSPSLEDDAELLRLLRFGTLGWVPPVEGSVFVPSAGGDFDRDWGQWLRGEAAMRLGAHVLAIRPHGEGMRAKEIVRESDALDAVLEGEAAGRSRIAGGSLLRVLASARHARLAGRVAALVDGAGGGREGLHLATAVALHSVVFNLPPLTALLGYAFAEWRAALWALGHPAARADAERFLVENRFAGEWAGGLLRASLSSGSRAAFAS